MIYAYLSDHSTPERFSVIIDIIELLARFNVVGIEAKLEQIAFDEPDLDTDGRVGKINELLIENLQLVLNLHSIVVTDTLHDLRLLYNMANTLKLVSEDYDPSYILSAVSMDMSETNEAIDIYANLVNLVTESRVDDVLDSIYSIEDVLIVNLQNILIEKDIPESQFDLDNDAVNRYRRYLQGRRVGLVYDMVVANLEIGKLDFNVLFSLVDSTIDSMNREDTIFELMSLVLISSTPTDEILTTLDRVSRLMGATEADAAVYLSELTREYQTITGI